METHDFTQPVGDKVSHRFMEWGDDMISIPLM